MTDKAVFAEVGQHIGEIIQGGCLAAGTVRGADRSVGDVRWGHVTLARGPAGQPGVGQEIVTSLGHLRRIASVVPTERITRLAERAARRSWLMLRVFDDKEEAVHWLLEEGEERQSA